jgi:hypothetical protein
VAHSTRSRLWGLITHRRGFRLVDSTGVGVPEDLIGFDAPSHWSGVVLGTTGTMRHLDDEHPPQRVRIGYALGRSGIATSTITTLDGRTLATPGGAPVGHIPDVAHRILGMPTEPEARTPLALMVTSWLLEVVDLATDPAMSGWTDDWLAVADLHPAADLCAGRTPGALSAALHLPGAIPTWEDVHEAAVTTGLGIGGFLPWHVEWLDPSSLGRFLLARVTPVHELLTRVVEVVPSEVARSVTKCVLGAATVENR